MSEGKGTSVGEGKAGGRRLRFRERLASLFEKAVLSAPPAVPTLLQQAPWSQQRLSFLPLSTWASLHSEGSLGWFGEAQPAF